MAALLILLAAWKLSQGSALLVFAVLFVFVVALAGYLFAEQKNKVEHYDPTNLMPVKRRQNERHHQSHQ